MISIITNKKYLFIQVYDESKGASWYVTKYIDNGVDYEYI